MSKKMMKRAAALSTLIAISLSGTVMAADFDHEGRLYMDQLSQAGYESGVTYDNVTIDNVIEDYNNSSTAVVSKGTDEKLSAADSIVISANNGGISTDVEGSHITVSAPSVSIENVGYLSGIHVDRKNAKVSVNGFDEFSIDATANGKWGFPEGNGIRVNQDGAVVEAIGNEGSSIQIDGGQSGVVLTSNGKITLSAGTIDITTIGHDGKPYKGQTIVNTGGGTIDILATDKISLTNHNVKNTNVYAVYSTNGDINIHTADGADKKADVIVNGDVRAEGTSAIDLRMETDASVLNGTVTTDGEAQTDITLSNGAVWNVPSDSNVQDNAVSNLTVEDANIVMAGDGQTITVDNFAGDNATITTNSLNNTFTAKESTATNTTVQGTAALTNTIENDADADINEYLIKLANTTVDADGETIATNIELAEGILFGATSATIGADGTLTNVVTKENKANAGLIDMTALSFLAWRGENDDLNERLGNLRSARENHGIWTRMSRAQQSYNTVTNQYNMYQIGYDQQAGDWTLGAAYSYTDGKSWFEKGTGENTHNVFSLYGTKMNDNGTFVDLVAKYGNLDYDYKLQGGVGDGSYDTDAYSFSAEVGKRITTSTGAWVEPQVQLTYGTVDDVAFTTKNGYGVNVDSTDSFVARAGIMAGKPVHKGNIYLKASYLYDFAGEVEGTFSNGARSVDISRDLGGGWWEVGFGANFDLSKATHLYLDFEKAIAGEAEVEWKWNAGVRYSF